MKWLDRIEALDLHTKFSHSHLPPREIGITWSIVKLSPEEQYLQVMENVNFLRTRYKPSLSIKIEQNCFGKWEGNCESLKYAEERNEHNLTHTRGIQVKTWAVMQYLLTGEIIPVKNVFTAKALLDSSSLYYLQQLWNLNTRGGTAQWEDHASSIITQ